MNEVHLTLRQCLAAAMPHACVMGIRLLVPHVAPTHVLHLLANPTHRKTLKPTRLGPYMLPAGTLVACQVRRALVGTGCRNCGGSKKVLQGGRAARMPVHAPSYHDLYRLLLIMAVRSPMTTVPCAL